jgi:hypothetical protein
LQPRCSSLHYKFWASFHRVFGSLPFSNHHSHRSPMRTKGLSRSSWPGLSDFWPPRLAASLIPRGYPRLCRGGLGRSLRGARWPEGATPSSARRCCSGERPRSASTSARRPAVPHLRGPTPTAAVSMTLSGLPARCGRWNSLPRPADGRACGVRVIRLGKVGRKSSWRISRK